MTNGNEEQSFALRSVLLMHVEQLHVKYQRSSRGNVGRRPCGTVGEVGRDYQLPTAANLHAGHSFIPTCDYLTRTQCEPERLVPITTTIELLAIRQPSSVVDGHGAACRGFLTLAGRHVLISQTRRRPRHGRGIDLERGAEASFSGRPASIRRAVAAQKSKGDDGEERPWQKNSEV
jgi:hypothetical protein